jgi:hypothetical protein
MSSDLERLLEQLVPRGAPPPLRERVLAQVDRALTTPPTVWVRRWSWAALAACLLLGAVLNFGLAKAHEARLAQIYGPEPVPRQIEDLTRTIAWMTDAQTASRMRQDWLIAVRQRRAAAAANSSYLSGIHSQLPGKD